MSVRCLEVLLAEAGGGGLLIVLESSIAIVLITCRCECSPYDADSYRESVSNVHFWLVEGFQGCDGVLANLNECRYSRRRLLLFYTCIGMDRKGGVYSM